MVWLLNITHNPSGEVLFQREIRDEEILDPEALTDQALADSYDGELKRAKANGCIPSGCGEYTTEIRHEEHSPGNCWDRLDWFPEIDCV